MRDVMREVNPGDPLVIAPATFNNLVDAAREFLRRKRDIGRKPAPDRSPFETVLLKKDQN